MTRGFTAAEDQAESKKFAATTLKGFTYPEFNNGVKIWELRGQDARLDANENVEILAPELQLFGNEKPALIRSEKALFILKSKECMMSGNVRGMISGDFEVKTELARFDSKISRINFPGPFEVQGLQAEFKGNGGHYDIREKKLVSENGAVLFIDL
ncbi:MAG: hypothetical protein HQL31_00255 [Planctomycetes bacterium]|nr:hypothetical protein [Planctomycetota bacterium]